MAEVATQSSGAVLRPPRILVPLIKEDLRLGDEERRQAGMEHYRAAGEKMIEAKSQLARGEFGLWIKRNFKLTSRHAERYMAFARATDGTQNRRYDNFSDFMRQDGGDPGYGKVVRKTGWHDEVKDTISKAAEDAMRLAREDSLTRKQEREAEQKLALRLIDIGYKVLAKELHPDKLGGDRDAMARLNRVRTRLKDCAGG
jgi:hypothetical protein